MSAKFGLASITYHLPDYIFAKSISSQNPEHGCLQMYI